MNKTELIEALAKKTGLTKADASRCLNALFSTAPREGIITTEVAKGQKVQITGFGAFESRKRKKREGRNPRTGESVNVPAKRVPFFKASNELKASLNEKD